MPRTAYIASTTNHTYGSEFTLTAGETRRFYASPGLQFSEKVEAQLVKDSHNQSLGYILTAEGVEAGLVYNDSDSTQTYRLIKSATDTATEIQYDS